jgi:hypothetical protein
MFETAYGERQRERQRERERERERERHYRSGCVQGLVVLHSIEYSAQRPPKGSKKTAEQKTNERQRKIENKKGPKGRKTSKSQTDKQNLMRKIEAPFVSCTGEGRTCAAGTG